MSNTSTNTLLRTMEWAKKLTFGRRSALGSFLEPALTSANIILQTILGAPFAWRWNRVVTGFVTVPGQQDYTLINWQPFMTVRPGWVTVDDKGNCHVVISAIGPTGGIVPWWSYIKGGSTNDGLGGGGLPAVVWQNLGPIGVPVSQTYSLGFIETASVLDTVLSVPKWFELTSMLCLASDSSQGRPRYISAQGDDGNGNVTFRLMVVPDRAYPVAITIQKKPPMFTSVNQTWAPIPDEYARLYNWGFLSMMWSFADDPRFAVANQKFVSQLIATAEGLSETQRNIFLQGWQQTSGQPVVDANRVAQGTQARGM